MIHKQFNWNTRFEPTREQFQKIEFDPVIEGLRGLAAIWVCYSHAISTSYNLDPTYKPLSLFGGGLDAVLIFFILSGYVIGLTNKEKFSSNEATLYLLKRGVRLLPMYFLAVVLSYIVSPIDSWQTVIGNIFLLQNLAVPTISGNGPLWSLNYEFIYYLVFLYIWRFRPKILSILIWIVTIILIGSIFHNVPSILISYLVGWLFWLFGLFLAWRIPSQNKEGYVPLLSTLLVLLATSEMHLGETLMDVLKIKNPETIELLGLGSIISLPSCISLFTIVANRPLNSVVALWTNGIAFLMPFSAICYGIFGKGRLSSENWIAAAIEIWLAVALVWIKINPSILKNLAFLGSISYGIYVFHSPSILFIRNNFPKLISGTIWSFLLRFVLLTILTISLAAFVELKVQPRIKSWFQKNIFVNFSKNMK